MNRPAHMRLDSWECSYSIFSSTDLTRITGIPGPIQRLWRSRGFLAKSSGANPTFSTLEAAEIFVRYDLSKFGLPPSESKEIGEAAAKIVLLFALLNSDGACEVIGKHGEVSGFLEEFEEDPEIAIRLCGNPELHRYLFRTLSGQIAMVDSLEMAVANHRLRSGAFMDLEQAASEFATRAKGPLISVCLSAEGESDTRRLTGQQATRLRLVKVSEDG